MTARPVRQAAWFWALPVLACSALLVLWPLAGLIDVALHAGASTSPSGHLGLHELRQLALDAELRAILLHQLGFTAVALAVELPLGIALALAMPRAGRLAGAVAIAVAVPLIVPWAAVGALWRIAADPQVGLLGASLQALGLGWRPAERALDAWLLLLAVDVWHWTPLVALLCHAALRTLPAAGEHAADLDRATGFGAFRHLAWPRLRAVLVVAAVLRLADGLASASDPATVLGGGPGQATGTSPLPYPGPFLAGHVVRWIAGGLEPGPAAVLSLLWFGVVAAAALVLYLALRRVGAGVGEDTVVGEVGEVGEVGAERSASRLRRRGQPLLLLIWLVFSALPLAALVALSLKPTAELAAPFTFWPQAVSWDHYRALVAGMHWTGLADWTRWTPWSRSYLQSLGYAAISTVASLLIALPAAYALSRRAFFGDRTLMAWLLVNRLTPPAILLGAYLQGAALARLTDSPVAVASAHLLFTLPIAVWILEGVLSRVPRSLDEAARMDGHSFGYVLRRILLPLIRRGVAVAAAYCFVASWSEQLLARVLMSGPVQPAGEGLVAALAGSRPDWGVAAAATVMLLLPGLFALAIIRSAFARGLSFGRL